MRLLRPGLIQINKKKKMDIRLFRYKTIFLKSVVEVHHHHHPSPPHHARTHAPLSPRLSCCNAAMLSTKCHREGHFALGGGGLAGAAGGEDRHLPLNTELAGLGAPRQLVLLHVREVVGEGGGGAVDRV